jgi:membrane-bound lytic murein transglycosylase D
MFEDWPLALAAYNAGEGKIQAAIQRQRTRDFWKLRLPRETRLFVPAFMAMTVIAREPERYGFSPPPEAPLDVDSVTLDRPAELKVIARAARMTVEEIRDLNPELIRWATPPHLPRYSLRIPAGRRADFLEALEQVPPDERFTWVRHKIRKGETPAGIARRYGVDLRALLEINGLRKRQALRSGGILLVPPSQAGRVAARAEEIRGSRQAAAGPAARSRYTVKKGDTLTRIARAHGVSLEDLRRWNGLSRDAAIRPGQRLQIASPAEAGSATAWNEAGPHTAQDGPVLKRYVVKRGDTLWDIARAHAVSLEDLRRWNDLSRDAAIRPGQELEIREPAS